MAWTPQSTGALFALAVLASALALRDAAVLVDPDRRPERIAVATPYHPLAGFWKEGGCDDDFGLAIVPAGEGLYSVSFCGPGGCFKPGTYRRDTPIVGDADYRVLDNDAIEVSGGGGFARFVRCDARPKSSGMRHS